MDFRLVGLAQANNQNPVMAFSPMLREALIGRDKQALFAKKSRPKHVIIHALIGGASNVENVVTQPAQFLNRSAGDVLIHENLHSEPTVSRGVTCSSASDAA